MKSITFVFALLFFGLLSARANSLHIYNNTCDDFTFLIVSTGGFYGEVTVPSNTDMFFSDPNAASMNPAVNNTSGVTPASTETFNNIRGWNVNPMSNAFSLNPSSTFYMSSTYSWLLANCIDDFVAFWGGTNVTVVVQQ